MPTKVEILDKLQALNVEITPAIRRMNKAELEAELHAAELNVTACTDSRPSLLQRFLSFIRRLLRL